MMAKCKNCKKAVLVDGLCGECLPEVVRDAHTGRPEKWECICIRTAHPHCPQHGEARYRRDDIPRWMEVSCPIKSR